MKKEWLNIQNALLPTEKKKFRWLLLADILLNLADLIFIAALIYLVQLYSNNSENTSLISQLYLKHPLWLLGGFITLYALKNAWGYFTLRSQYLFVYQTACRISNDRLMEYLNSDFESHVHADTAKHIRAVSQHPIEFGHYVLRGVQVLISQICLIGLTIIGLIWYSPTLFMMLLAIMIIPVSIAGWFLKSKLSKVRMHARSTSENSLQYLKEALNSFVEANIDGKKSFFADRYSREQKRLNYFLSEQQVVQNIPSRLFEVVAVLGVFLLVLDSSLQQELPLINLAAFAAAAYKIIPGITKIMNSVGQIKNYRYSIIAARSYVAATPLSTLDLVQVNSIEFEHVSFSYGDKKVLDKFFLQCRKGQIFRLDGLSGRGKTTAINLLLGFLEAESGNILINGRAFKAEERKQFWPTIAYIKQQPFFLHDSLRKNICLSDQCEETRLQQALTLTGLNLVLKRRIAGVDSIMRENGKNFSGGERQRVILARALYKNASLLILDEPFSELDQESREAISEVLQQLVKHGKMIWLVTHSDIKISTNKETAVAL